jgi:SAM-dependent methyltransferase
VPFERNAIRWGGAALLAFGPLLIGANAAAQSIGFNPIFLSAGPQQFWLLLGVIGCYFLPFLASAMFLGSAFLVGARFFGRVYFADLLGAGLAGLMFLVAMAIVPPRHLLLVPLALWLIACLAWARVAASRALLGAALVLAALVVFVDVTAEPISTSPYKGVAYARHFPDAQRIYEDWGPQGYLEIYSSSYFHFAPGLSDMAAIDLPTMPENAYLGMFIDGDGPIGLMKQLPPEQSAYFRYLPMAMPYLLRPNADAFMVQFGGGISTRVALGLGARSVVAAEPNPLIPRALRSPKIAPIVGNILADPRITLIPTDGRIAIQRYPDHFDVIDLSLVDSIGLSSPGGLSVVEKYAYSRQAMLAYMRALKPGGILSVTIWNKENPPKAVPKLLTTMLASAEQIDRQDAPQSFFVSHAYLSTATILYRRGGFSAAEIQTLEAYNKHMAFDVVWSPDQKPDAAMDAAVLAAWHDPLAEQSAAPPAAGQSDGTDTTAGATDPTGPGATDPTGPDATASNVDMSATALYRAMLDGMMSGHTQAVEAEYGFAIAPVTDERPYLAGYVKPYEILGALQNFGAISDDWGFLLLWVSLSQSLLAGAVLILLPVAFGWRTIFQRQPGKLGLLGYFACLGLGYILVEVTLIASFVRALGNPTVSASIMLTGMLVMSGLGALASTRTQADCRRRLPPILLGVALLLALYALSLSSIIDAIGVLGTIGRMAAALVVAGLPAFFMGFALPSAMTELKALGKEPFFLWAWGINGLFSVGGAVAAPLIGVLFGLDTALWVAAACYLCAVPTFFSVLRPRPA